VWFARAEDRMAGGIGRFFGEVERVMEVLEGWLAGREMGVDGKKWLVGGRRSYADLAFVPYQLVVRAWLRKGGMGGEEFSVDEGKFPEVKGWLDAMLAVEGVEVALRACEPFGSMLEA
jgi:glutathione S-transferase